MGLLFDAAVAWDNLYDTTYDFLLGRKGRWSSSFILNFSPEDFPHLAGMQYATDIDFGLNRAEIRSGKFIAKILSGEIDDELILKSAEWKNRLRGRLEGITLLEETLDNNFEIYKFNPGSVPFGSRIDAKYVIKNARTGVTFFVFVADDDERWFCRSIFQLKVADYTRNQTHITVLKKKKHKNGEVILDYTHPHYKPADEGQETNDTEL